MQQLSLQQQEIRKKKGKHIQKQQQKMKNQTNHFKWKPTTTAAAPSPEYPAMKKNAGR